ncbi:MAG: hypothetical protein ACYTDT_02590 [Planctomycetota bacterium]|jgi:hypothetical protein
MSQDSSQGQTPKRNAGNAGRTPLKKPKMPGSSNSAISGMPGLPKATSKARPSAKPVSMPGRRTSGTTNPAEEAEPKIKRPSNKVRPSSAPSRPRKTSNPPQAAEDSNGSQKSARKRKPRESQRKEPKTIDELIAVVVKHAIRRDDGLTITNFDANFMPRIKAIIPAALKRMETEVINEYLVDLAHSIYIAIIVGKFNNRPTLCGVRAAELAADLLERVLGAIEGRDDKRITAIRSANLLVGLTLNAVRFLECTNFQDESLDGFTDRYERAVITAYGLKTQSEATGQAPWIGPSAMPLDKRIGKAINTMSSVFGNHIGEQGVGLSDSAYNRVLGEFDSFTEKFAPYIEGDRLSAEERRKKLSRSSEQRAEESGVTPLNVAEILKRPAGLELKTTEGKSYFISHSAAREIMSALLASSESQRPPQVSADSTIPEQSDAPAMEEVRDPGASSVTGSTAPVSDAPKMSDDDASALAEIEAQMQAAKDASKTSSDKPKMPTSKGKNPVRNPFG